MAEEEMGKEMGGGSEARPYEGPILYYSDAVIDHFTNPRNVGELGGEETDGYACIGGIPANKRHCSLLGVRALQAAIGAYERGASGSAAPREQAP